MGAKAVRLQYSFVFHKLKEVMQVWNDMRVHNKDRIKFLGVDYTFKIYLYWKTGPKYRLKGFICLSVSGLTSRGS